MEHTYYRRYDDLTKASDAEYQMGQVPSDGCI